MSGWRRTTRAYIRRGASLGAGQGRLATRPHPSRSAHAQGRPPTQLLPMGRLAAVSGAGCARLPSRRTSVAPSVSSSSVLVGQ